ncbi:hypothetical protein BOX17_04185 [Halomonas aestuarii]|uniref:Zinc resistance-associated protein n=1 Tax=Halomonas aestuarii TaxID=1897729 RepID=A0A1J0VE16_9GAMM|nr:hypothetical protein [Halomonas aestuarii]APE30218.1 hypothetical protein BOX17_04185 [Halomonas aestuarii]
MRRSLTRTLLAPALLAVAIAPLALSASASSGNDGHHCWHDGLRPCQEHRQALLDRASIDDETRQALEAARTEHREAVRELRAQHRQRMDEILGEQQREALDTARREMREERRAERREAMQQRMNALVDSWQLPDAKREALREAREAIYADMQALREGDVDSREARREAMRELREEHQATLTRLLSDEQIADMRALLSSRDGRHHGSKGHRHSHRADRDERCAD